MPDCPKMMLRCALSFSIETMRAGPVWVRLSAAIQASTVTELLSRTALTTFAAPAALEITVLVLTDSAPGSQETAAGFAIVRLSGVPTPEVSLTVEPLPSLKS